MYAYANLGEREVSRDESDVGGGGLESAIHFWAPRLFGLVPSEAS
jgi:hypothetical protein